MKTFKVNITEKLQMTVEVEAADRHAAERLAEQRWVDGEYILDADHFKGVSFTVERPCRGRDYER